MNEVSIIINGVRHDAVVVDKTTDGNASCEECDLFEKCHERTFLHLCSSFLARYQIFKKSDKKFEK